MRSMGESSRAKSNGNNNSTPESYEIELDARPDIELEMRSEWESDIGSDFESDFGDTDEDTDLDVERQSNTNHNPSPPNSNLTAGLGLNSILNPKPKLDVNNKQIPGAIQIPNSSPSSSSSSSLTAGLRSNSSSNPKPIPKPTVNDKQVEGAVESTAVDPTTELSIPTFLWKPIVKNWFCKDSYRDGEELLESDAGKYDWVFDPNHASMTLEVHTLLTNHKQPLLELRVNATFESAQDEKANVRIPQFLDHYQDNVSLSITPDAKKANQSFLQRSSYKAKLDDSANENNHQDFTYVSGHYQMGLNGGIPVGVCATYHSSHTQQTRRINDFKNSNIARNKFGAYYPAEQIQSYNMRYTPAKPCAYSIADPDESMHNYGHTPDSFCEPSTLAKGGLKISSVQEYVLKPNSQIIEMPINLKCTQRQIGMSIWRWCANYWFINRAELEYSCDLSVRGNEALINRYSLFTRRQPNEYDPNHIVEHMGPISSVEYRLNESWKGRNQTLSVLQNTELGAPVSKTPQCK